MTNKSANRWSFVVRWLRPTPLDAWLLATILFCVVATVASMLWYIDSGYTDAIDLTLPLLGGGLAMLIGLSVAAVHCGVSWWRLGLFVLTIICGAVVYLKAGYWLGIQEPQGLDYFEDSEDLMFADFFQACLWHPLSWLAVGLLLFLAVQCLPRVQNAVATARRQIPKTLSLLNKHRTKIMIGFVVIMLPAMVIRNALDPDMQASRPLASLVFLALFGVFILLLVFLFFRFVLSPRWFGVKFLLAIGIGGCVYYFWRRTIDSSYHLDLIGETTAWAVAPIFFLLSVLATAFVVDPDNQTAKFSIWSIVPALVVMIGVTVMARRLDLMVVTAAYVDEPKNFWYGDWVQQSLESRELQRVSGGAARVVSEYGRQLIYVRIRDRRDADCLQTVIKQSLSGPIVIVNLQPYVDTRPLTRFSDHLVLVDGRVTPQQMADICQAIQSLTLTGVQLPDRNDGATLSATLGTYGEDPVPGLAGFLDVYLSPSTNMVSLSAPLSPADWNAVIRNNQKRSFYVYGSLPSGAFDSPALAKQDSLSGIVVSHMDFTYDPHSLKLFLETDIKVESLHWNDLQLYWAFALAKPDAVLTAPWGLDDSRDLMDRAEDYLWAYGRDGQGNVTDLWLPDISAFTVQSGPLPPLKRLRMDRRGVMGIDWQQRDSQLMPVAKSFPNLQSLYLDVNHFVEDLRFLKLLPKLKHLQIQSQSRIAMPFNGFEVCTNLESMRIFGTPDPKSIGELATLKKLKRVEIIDDEQSFTAQTPIDQLKKQLPNVEIEIIAPEDFQPDLSEAFRKHVQRARQLLLERVEEELAE